MGILDILNPRSGMRSGGGMSPAMMAVMGLLAYKAVKHFGANREQTGQAGSSPGTQASSQGGLGDILGRLGAGGLGGAGLGSALSGGLSDLLAQFQDAGKGDVAHSWIGTGQNKPIDKDDMSKVLTPEQIAFLTERTGMSRDELLTALSQHLPGAVDELTPQGKVPSAAEMDRA